MESSPVDHQGSAPNIQLDVNQWGGHWGSPNTHTHTHTHTHARARTHRAFFPPIHRARVCLSEERGQKSREASATVTTSRAPHRSR